MPGLRPKDRLRKFKMKRGRRRQTSLVRYAVRRDGKYLDRDLRLHWTDEARMARKWTRRKDAAKVARRYGAEVVPLI